MWTNTISLVSYRSVSSWLLFFLVLTEKSIFVKFTLSFTFGYVISAAK